MQTAKAYKGTMQSANHSPAQPDDKNPDVVPLGKGNIDLGFCVDRNLLPYIL